MRRAPPHRRRSRASTAPRRRSRPPSTRPPRSWRARGCRSIFGLGGTSCEAQREAVALADALGAAVDTSGPLLDGASGTTFPLLGASTATLGDVRDRAQVVVIWRADPASTHPRLLERLRVDAPGRTLIVVDAHATPTAQLADVFVEVPAAADFDALWALRALTQDLPLDERLAADLPLDALRDVAGRLLACENGAILHGGGLSGGGAGERTAFALSALVRDLSRRTHIVTMVLRSEGNAAGAQDVLAWQTGYPSAVGLQAGHPRSEPGAAERVHAARPRRRRRGAGGRLRCARGAAPAGRRPPEPHPADHDRRGGHVGGACGAGRVHALVRRHPPRRHASPDGRRPAAAARARAVGSPRRRRAARRAADARRGRACAHDPHHRRPRPRPGERRGRRGPRPVPRRRARRRRRARPRPADRRARDGRHARRRGHPRAHRGAGGERRAAAVTRRAPRRCRRPHRDHALGHRRHRPVDVGHRLPLLAARLHDRRRGGDAAAGRPAHARGAARHPADRRRLPRAARQQPGPVRPDAPRAARRHPARARRRRLVARGDRRLRREDRQPRRRRALEARERQRRDARRRGRRAGRHAAPDPRDARDRGPRPRPAAPRPRPLQRPRRRRQLAHHARHPPAPSRAAVRTSPTSSSTPTAAVAAAGRARRRRSWPSISARIRSSARTSAR